jgi:hypothetical protein
LPTHTGNISGNVITANIFVGDGSQLTGLPESYTNSNVSAYLPTHTGNISADIISINSVQIGNLTMSSDNDGNLIVNRSILPSANLTYDLGSPTQRFKDLYLSNNTIYLGDVPLSISGNDSLSINGVTQTQPDAITRAGINWRQADLGVTSGSWNDMTKAGPVLFSLSNEFYGPSGTGNLQYRYSTDGISWSTSELPNQRNNNPERQKMPGTYDSKWIAYGNNTWVIMAGQLVTDANTLVRTSTDAITWTRHIDTVPFAYSYPELQRNDRGVIWYSTIFDGTKFVALGGESYFQNPCVMNSIDGINWTQVSPNGWDTSNFYTIPDSDSLYLQSSSFDDPGNPGVTNIGNFSGQGFYKWVDMATDNNVIIAVGSWSWADFTALPEWDGDFVALSYDHGVNWQYVRTPIKAIWDRIEYANGTFIVTGEQNTLLEDGIPVNGTYKVPAAIRSTNGGLSWSTVRFPNIGTISSLNSVVLGGLAYGDGNWVICILDSRFTSPGYVLVSTDSGQSFTESLTDPVRNPITNELQQIGCNEVQYINNRFVAASNSAVYGSLLQVSAATVNLDDDCCLAEKKFNIRSNNFNAIVGLRYGVDTTNNTVTATLPADPELGDAILFVDAAGMLSTSSFTINGNGNNVMGSSSQVFTTNDITVGVFFNGTQWKFYSN